MRTDFSRYQGDQTFLKAADIHQQIGAWPTILAQLGVPEDYLRKKNGPCPGCGGTDRYFFDNKYGKGDFFCRSCSPKGGDGFGLLKLVFGWSFSEARTRVIEAAGLNTGESRAPARQAEPVRRPAQPVQIARLPDRVLRIRRDRCAIEDCDSVVDYLAQVRRVWPLPAGCSLRANASAEYWNDGRRIGRYPAIVADVVDIDGDLVTCHVTYLEHGKKLSGYEARKTLSSTTGRTGCAVRLMPAGETLGIAEGIETALAAAVLDEVPVWSALNASLLARFEPPPGVTSVRIYADRDEAGLSAALKLFERLQGRIRVETKIPPTPAKDWNDVLIRKREIKSATT